MSKNCDELRAQQWLKSQGYTDIIDLSIDGTDPPARHSSRSQRSSCLSVYEGSGCGRGGVRMSRRSEER